VRFDLIVLGTGSGALTVARKCREAGWTVAVVDSQPFGGTCALRGCDPKKVLVGAAEALDGIRRLQGRGLDPAGARIIWSDLIAFKRTFIEPVPRRTEDGLSSLGIETHHGRARFVGPRSVRVGDTTLEARYLHIATGAEPAKLGFPGADLLTHSDEFLALENLPASIVFVGGGYISFEFAHIAVRAGAKVTLLHRSERPLGGFDPELVHLLVERSRELGIDLRLGCEVTSLERGPAGLVVRSRSSTGEETLEADLAVHGAGRVPALDDLDLECANVERDRLGVRVNEYLQSVSNPHVYAAGDAAASGPPLTPVASYQAHVASANLLKGNHRKVEYPPIPSVVFTIPPLAAVGLHQAEAERLGVRHKVKFGRTSEWYSSRRVGETSSGYKIILDEGSDRILGAHLLGPDASEVINVFAIALRAGLTAGDMKQMIYAYPTVGSDISYMV
jgi:glutathione reductase (NADPH)